MHIGVIHKLPGRIRLAVPLVRRGPGMAVALGERVLCVGGVIAVKANANTGSMLVFYDTRRLTGDELVRAIGMACDSFRKPSPTGGPDPRVPMNVVAPGLLLGAVGAKRLLFGPSALSETPWLPTASGILGVVSAYPIIRDGLRNLAKGRLDTNLVVAAGSVVLLVTRESVPGLMFLWLLNLSKWMEGLALERTRRMAQTALEGFGAQGRIPNPRDAEPVSASPGLTAGPLILAGILLATTGSLSRALAVLIAASPRSLDLAAPMARGYAMAASAGFGLFPASSEAIERIGDTDTALIDPELLTASSPPEATSIIPLDPTCSDRDILSLAHAALSCLNDPVSRAIADKAESLGLHPAPCTDPEPVYGMGVIAKAKGGTLVVGLAPLLVEHGIDPAIGVAHATQMDDNGEDALYVAFNGRVLGLIGLSRPMRPEARGLVETLRDCGVTRFGLVPTGPIPLRAGTKRLFGAGGIDTGTEGFERAMVLATSPDAVRIMGTSATSVAPADSRVAPYADVVVAGGGLERVGQLVCLGRMTRDVKRQNGMIASAFATIGTALAVSGSLTATMALFLLDASSILVIANSSRILGLDWSPRNTAPAPAALAPVSACLEPGTAVGNVPWHTMTGEQAMSVLGTTARFGLTGDEAARRLAAYGGNRLAKEPPPSMLALFAKQFQNLMVVTLVGASGVALASGSVKDSLTILGTLVVNGVFGMYQEYHSGRSVEALRRLAAPTARVVRDGRPMVIPAEGVVAGDLLVLGPGDRVPADGRLIEASGLEVEESSLTGESVPVHKQLPAIPEERAGVADRTNLVYMGTSVVKGRGSLVVTATGMSTEMGHILAMLTDVGESATPLQRSMDGVGRVMLTASVVVAGSVIAIGLLRGHPFLTMLMTGVSLAVAAIPEGLPVTVTLALTSGVRRMAAQKAIARRLSAIETLGTVSVICSDKTGTMTRNAMEVRAVWSGDGLYMLRSDANGAVTLLRESGEPAGMVDDVLLALGAAATCCDGGEDGSAGTGTGWRKPSDPLDSALQDAVTKLLSQAPGPRNPQPWEGHDCLGEVPFDPERKRVTVLVRSSGGRVFLITKGAHDTVVPLCDRYHKDRGVHPLEPRLPDIDGVCGRMASNALRVLAVAYRELQPHEVPDSPDPETLGALEQGMVLLGVIGMMDPPRPGVAESVERAKRLGIRVVMITGDHPSTARAIAGELGILDPDGVVLTGNDIDAMDDPGLDAILPSLRICARVAPRHKLRVVRALKRAGHVMAMTGDGVNDAPAVKEADVGIAMGSGTDTTKEASALILTDDNFTTIVNAVEEGRAVRANIRNALGYNMCGNTGEVLVMLLGVALGMPLPLVPMQLLLINVLSDGLPVLLLATAPPDPSVLDKPPISPNEGLFSRGLGAQVLVRGTMMGLQAFGLYAWAVRGGNIARARSLLLASLIMDQWAQVPDWQFEGHPERYPERKRDPKLAMGTVVSAAALPLLFGMPWFSGLFGTTALSLLDWGLVAGSAMALNRASATVTKGYGGRPEKAPQVPMTATGPNPV